MIIKARLSVHDQLRTESSPRSQSQARQRLLLPQISTFLSFEWAQFESAIVRKGRTIIKFHLAVRHLALIPGGPDIHMSFVKQSLHQEDIGVIHKLKTVVLARTRDKPKLTISRGQDAWKYLQQSALRPKIGPFTLAKTKIQKTWVFCCTVYTARKTHKHSGFL